MFSLNFDEISQRDATSFILDDRVLSFILGHLYISIYILCTIFFLIHVLYFAEPTPNTNNSSMIEETGSRTSIQNGAERLPMNPNIRVLKQRMEENNKQFEESYAKYHKKYDH